MENSNQTSHLFITTDNDKKFTENEYFYQKALLSHKFSNSGNHEFDREIRNSRYASLFAEDGETSEHEEPEISDYYLINEIQNSRYAALDFGENSETLLANPETDKINPSEIAEIVELEEAVFVAETVSLPPPVKLLTINKTKENNLMPESSITSTTSNGLPPLSTITGIDYSVNPADLTPLNRINGNIGINAHTSPVVATTSPVFNDNEEWDGYIEIADLYNNIINAIEPAQIFEAVDGQTIPQSLYYSQTAVILNTVSIQAGHQLTIRHEQVYIWTSTHWLIVDKERFIRFIYRFAAALNVPQLLLDEHHFLTNLEKNVFKKLEINGFEKRDQQIRLNLNNGTLWFDKTGTRDLKPFSPEDYMFYQLPYNYKPEAKIKKWQEYLDSVLPGDKESQMTLQEYVGWLFVKHSAGILKLERVLCLHGTGSNGKGIFQEVITALLGGGDNVMSADLGSICNDPNVLALLENKILNYSGEVSGLGNGQDKFKTISSGEPVNVRLLYQNNHRMTDYAKIICNINVLPKQVEQSDGYYRRFMIVNFEQNFEKNGKKVIDYHKTIINDHDEMSAILNWALEGLDRLFKTKKFTESSRTKEALAEYRIDTNPVEKWILEHEIEKSDEYNAESKTLFKKFIEWSDELNYKRIGEPEFGQRMKRLGFTKKQKRLGNERPYFYNVKKSSGTSIMSSTKNRYNELNWEAE